MNLGIILSVVSGIAFGLFVFPDALIEHVGVLIDLGLCLLLFFVGIDIGRNKDIINQIRKAGFRILLVPLMIALGSIVGGLVGGIILGIPLNESGAIGAGFGWYSLSAVLLAKYSAETGAIAFITNVWREVIALILIPYVAKYIGKLESIAPAGATAMDTTLPVIARVTDGSIALVSFVSGVVLSSLVPILVPIIISL